MCQEHHQNVIICSSSHYQHFLKISLKSIHNFWSYLANKQTDKRRQKHIKTFVIFIQLNYLLSLRA